MEDFFKECQTFEDNLSQFANIKVSSSFYLHRSYGVGINLVVFLSVRLSSNY